ncbi:hypothetical protein BH10PSE19_BH10PSE19_06070 [soil metagenome]
MRSGPDPPSCAISDADNKAEAIVISDPVKVAIGKFLSLACSQTSDAKTGNMDKAER